MLGSRPWSSVDVMTSLLRDTATARDRAWLVRYFVARRAPGLLARFVPPPPEDGALHLRQLSGPLHVGVGSGGVATYYEIALQRVYTPSSDWLPAASQTVIDVGANVGVFALWAAGRIGPDGRLVAVEPNPEATPWLRRNLAPFEDRAGISEVACGESDARLTLRYPPGRLSVGSLLPRHDRTKMATVTVRPLDDLLDEHGVGEIDLLKIDVEGVEAQVLAGSARTLERTRRLALEVAGDKLEEATDLVTGAGLEPAGRISGMWGLPEANGVVAYFERP